MSSDEYLYGQLKAAIEAEFTGCVFKDAIDLAEISKHDTAHISLNITAMSYNDDESEGGKVEDYETGFDVTIGIKTNQDIDDAGLIRTASKDWRDKLIKCVRPLKGNWTGDGYTGRIKQVRITGSYISPDHKQGEAIMWAEGRIKESRFYS